LPEQVETARAQMADFIAVRRRATELAARKLAQNKA